MKGRFLGRGGLEVSEIGLGCMGQVAVPVMIINALDDPVCVAANAADHVDAIRRVPDALLVRTAHGSHCAFFEGWSPSSWAHRLMAEYLLAATEVSR